jgi:hypothetical protein
VSDVSDQRRYYERMIDEIAATYREQVDQLQDENAKLREQLDVAEHNQTRNAREYARLCHENDKLRELVQDIYVVMWACAEQRCTHRHDGCFRVHGNHGDICASERCWYEDRMSELGIEV